MRAGSRWLACAGALAVLTLASCDGGVPVGEAPPDVDDVAAATVTLGQGHCAGVVVEDGSHALTAAHCVSPLETRVDVSFMNGQRIGGTYVHVDRGRDVAIIRLDARAPVRGLEVADAMPTPGEPLVFTGRFDRPGDAQEAVLERLGRCPSLPQVPAALFTTMRGRPGDSGAPLVDSHMRVVGLVHGGAACRIATPTAGLGTLVGELSRGGPTLAHQGTTAPR
ncbi:trypsin-like peptidase domain-containing protein [Pyxidicoccus parkwayensis]|uniref:Trypsin-like peptidase domain-containing protein n=1 Tax=Pyxidicoccus parkwayensis TaxID=2813578 RepID=A0ABX7NXW9_9BACT|nr:serine protease [Pyxidicoccus parkwaysis]QSQ23660.1 trypsin-like peptidase domain-containing protein [Pyxidicoccus parkwaysis]